MFDLKKLLVTNVVYKAEDLEKDPSLVEQGVPRRVHVHVSLHSARLRQIEWLISCATSSPVAHKAVTRLNEIISHCAGMKVTKSIAPGKEIKPRYSNRGLRQ